MAGYANRVMQLQFPDLSEDGDLIWVAIRNPKTQPPSALRPVDVETDADGKPINAEAAVAAMYGTISNLLIGGHVYDATFEGLADDGTPLDQPLLAAPWTSEKVAKLPMEIISAIGKEIAAGVNPQ